MTVDCVGFKSRMQMDGSLGYQHIVCLHTRNFKTGVWLGSIYSFLLSLKGIKKLSNLCRQLVNLFILKKERKKRR